MRIALNCSKTNFIKIHEISFKLGSFNGIQLITVLFIVLTNWITRTKLLVSLTKLSFPCNFIWHNFYDDTINCLFLIAIKIISKEPIFFLGFFFIIFCCLTIFHWWLNYDYKFLSFCAQGKAKKNILFYYCLLFHDFPWCSNNFRFVSVLLSISDCHFTWFSMWNNISWHGIESP